MLPLLSLLVAVHIAPSGAQIEYRQPQLAATADLVAVTFGAENRPTLVTDSVQGVLNMDSHRIYAFGGL